MQRLSTQRGEGVWGYILLIVVIVMFGKIGYATIPAHIEDRALDKLITEKLQQHKQDTGEQFLSRVQKSLNMDFAGTKVADVVQVVQGTPGSLILKKNYDVSSTLFGNISIVSHFEKEYRQ